MRIYLACTVRGCRSGLAATRLIAARLEALGHEVLTKHLLEDDVEGAEATLSERDVFERDLAWLDACDAVVAEASGSTYGVGFEVGYVLGRAPRTGQRACVLYDAGRQASVSRLVSGNTLPACVVVAYRSLEDVEEVIAREFGSAPCPAQPTAAGG